MEPRSPRLMGRCNRSGELLIRMRNGQPVPLKETNPYVKESVEMREFLFTSVEIKAKFPEIFPDPHRRIWADIGCYFGETIAEMAGLNRDLNFLGVDIRYKRVVKSVRRIRQAGLENARIALCDAAVFLDSLPVHGLAGVSVFFPDPWPRRRHRKHRFVNRDFLEQVASRLEAGGVFWFKTDQEDYFNEVKAQAEACGFSVGEFPPRILESRDYDSFFQRLFQGNDPGFFQLALRTGV